MTAGPEQPNGPPASTRGDRGDIALMAMLFGVNLVPLVGAAVSGGRWGQGTLGLATAGALVTGRELVLGARDLLHRRR
ncbi:MAG TPA: hypothetical protein VFL83_07220 [Anaeromyxobacter sp.]|nr:hypothetical protein [Anaeromyxobacter sp.]